MKNTQKRNQTELTKQEEAIVNGFSQEAVERIMTPKNDFVFKKLFGTVGREKMVKDFLEAILNIKIKTIELGKETILLPDEVDEKVGVLDVRLTLEDGTEIDLEMQNAQNSFIIKRSHFYASRLYAKKIEAGGKYQELKKAIVIFITNFEVFSKLPKYHTIWKMTEQDYLEEHFDEIELHFIELPKFLATKYNKKRKIDQWLLFLDYSQREMIREIMEENENVKEAEEAMEKMKKDKHLQYLAWLREKQILDSNSMKYEGIMIGREEGRKEGIKDTAKRMLKANIDIEVIIQVTELTKEEIEEIKKEIDRENT